MEAFYMSVQVHTLMYNTSMKFMQALYMTMSIYTHYYTNSNQHYGLPC
jgi:hypothetical protein